MKPPTPQREHVLLLAARIENAGAFGRSYSLAYKVKCLQLEASSWKNHCFFSEQITRMPSFLRVLVSAHLGIQQNVPSDFREAKPVSLLFSPGIQMKSRPS